MTKFDQQLLNSYRWLAFLLVAAFILAWPDLAVAEIAVADDSWSKGGETIIYSVTYGLKKWAGPVIGLSMIIFGIVTAVMGRFNLQQAAYIVGAGIVIAVGPAFASMLVSAGG